MDAKLLIEQMRNQRKRWVEVAPGKSVQILLPTEMEVVRHFVKAGDDGKVALTADLEETGRFVVDWRGFTEADLLGAANAPDDPAPFDAELWKLAASDHLDWHRKVAQALLTGIVDRQTSREADEKNSQPS